MESNLRPMTLSEILDRTAQLYRENFQLFAGIFSLYAAVTLVFGLLQIGLGVVLQQHDMTKQLLWVTITVGGVGILELFLLYGAAAAAISRAVAWVHLGEPATIQGAYRSILPRLGRYLWLMTVTAFVVYLPLALLYGGFFGLLLYKGLAQGAQKGAAIDPHTAATVAIAGLIFFVLLIPVGIYTVIMSLRYSLALPACVVEDLKATKALRRSVDLSKGAKGRIFVLGLLVAALKIGLVLFTQLFLFVSIIKHQGQVSPLTNTISQIISFFTTSFLGPILATGLTLFYYDQRVRKEGYDIEWMMQAAGLTPPALAASSEIVPEVADDEPDASNTGESA